MRIVESFSDKDVERFRKLARKHTRKTTRSRKAAVKSLQEAGILGPDGKLMPQYRTPRRTRKRSARPNVED